MDNYDSEPHREHTFPQKKLFQLLDGGRPEDLVEERILLVLFFLRVLLADFDVPVVVVVEVEQRLIGRRVQFAFRKVQKAVTAMCV